MTRFATAMAAGLVAALTLTLSSCGTSEEASKSTPTSSPEQFESPAAPMETLTTEGKHCFASASDAAAAAARIQANYSIEVTDIENRRKLADAGGPLPAIGSDEVSTASDPDENNCVTVSKKNYDD